MNSDFRNSFLEDNLSSTSGSSGATFNSLNDSLKISQQLEMKVDMVYSLLSLLDLHDNQADMGETLLALSSNPESCVAMRQSGCITLLIQVIYSEKELHSKKKAIRALHNLVHSNPDDKIRRKEVRILKILEEILNFTSVDVNMYQNNEHPCETVSNLMKFSFDEDYRHVICRLGGVFSIAGLIEYDHKIHGSYTINDECIILRRYCGMILTNLTFGDCENKSQLCSIKSFMTVLLNQLNFSNEELIQVTTSLIRNLSWKANELSKEILRELDAIKLLFKVAMESKKESTLKSALSALWNISSHSSENKIEICSTDGSLEFLISLLNYKSQSKTLTVVENAGGILRNISNHLENREDYRQILRKLKCFNILVEQLASPSLTIVSNACGTLWNLSMKSIEDQHYLCEIGAITMLKTLSDSKHKIIASSSKATLRNLLNSRPISAPVQETNSISKTLNLIPLPTLNHRKNKFQKQDVHNSNYITDNFNNLKSNFVIESDLEQPTDYSLKYSEKDDDVLTSQNIRNTTKGDNSSNDSYEELDEHTNAITDSTKTYYTEDTPGNFSSAVSLTDLRTTNIDEKSISNDMTSKKSNLSIKKLKNDNISGISTPEKPINFCEEGTPAELSRISSFSALSIDDNESNESIQQEIKKLVSDTNLQLENNEKSYSHYPVIKQNNNNHLLNDNKEMKDNVVTDFKNKFIRNISDEESIVSKCITLGIHKNRYSQIKSNAKKTHDFNQNCNEINQLKNSNNINEDKKNNLIENCINLGIYKNKSEKKSKIIKHDRNISSDTDENYLIEQCINIGLYGNRQNKKENSDLNNDNNQKIESYINLGRNCNRFQKSLKKSELGKNWDVVLEPIRKLNVIEKKPPNEIDILSETNRFEISENVSLSLIDIEKCKRKETLSSKRALNQKLTSNHSNTCSNLSLDIDSIDPPSIMNDANDVIDLQNSMCSLDSISSEVIDKNLSLNTNMISSVNCIENIEPPSLLMDHVVCDEENGYMDKIVMNSKERRLLHKDRFKTYIISSTNDCYNNINMLNEQNCINYNNDEVLNYSDNDMIVKARIIKNFNEKINEEENSKAIRGRKKQLYKTTVEKLPKNNNVLTRIPISAKTLAKGLMGKSNQNFDNNNSICKTDTKYRSISNEKMQSLSNNNITNITKCVDEINNNSSSSTEIRITKKKKEITSKIASLLKRTETLNKTDTNTTNISNKLWLGKNNLNNSTTQKSSINNSIP